MTSNNSLINISPSRTLKSICQGATINIGGKKRQRDVSGSDDE